MSFKSVIDWNNKIILKVSQGGVEVIKMWYTLIVDRYFDKQRKAFIEKRKSYLQIYQHIKIELSNINLNIL